MAQDTTNMAQVTANMAQVTANMAQVTTNDTTLTKSDSSERKVKFALALPPVGSTTGSENAGTNLSTKIVAQVENNASVNDSVNNYVANQPGDSIKAVVQDVSNLAVDKANKSVSNVLPLTTEVQPTYTYWGPFQVQMGKIIPSGKEGECTIKWENNSTALHVGKTDFVPEKRSSAVHISVNSEKGDELIHNDAFAGFVDHPVHGSLYLPERTGLVENTYCMRLVGEVKAK